MSHDDIFNARYGPRRARGGIKPSTTRGAFGKSWWAQRWIKYLESFELGGRLARGRTYARHGQVLGIEIEVGLVTARVQGSRFEPYEVKIEVAVIPEEKWFELSKTDFNQAIIAAKLLAGDMPEDIEQVFSKHALSLFPAHEDDLKTDCSCPDFSNPCKHIASVYYLLGEEFDRDPFLIFKMRGMPKDKLVGLITQVETAPGVEVPAQSEPAMRSYPAMQTKPATQSKPSTQSNPAMQSNPDTPGLGTANGARPEADSFPLQLEKFWDIPTINYNLVNPSVPASSASLPKRLGSFPLWRSSHPFLPTLEDIYKKTSISTKAALDSAKLKARE